MTVAKVVELSASSQRSFEDAITEGVKRASQTIRNVRSAWVKEQSVDIRDGAIARYRVNILVTFVLDEEDEEDEADEM